MQAPERARVLSEIADEICARLDGNVLRVGIDGRDGAGKTMFADELGKVVESRGCAVIRASTDSFHNPRKLRYRLGRSSPEGYFLDSFNLSKLRELLLDPLSPGGTGRYCQSYFDHLADSCVSPEWRQATKPSILLFDGIFIHRDELLPYWDFSVFLSVSTKEGLRRCHARAGGGSTDPMAAENMRYVLGQQLYFERCEPQSRATIVVDNEDLARPRIVAAS